MAAKLTRQFLGQLYRKVAGKHSMAMLEIVNENAGKEMKEITGILEAKDQEIAVDIVSPIIRELARIGVDFSPAWKVLDEAGLVEWAKEQNGS